MFLFTLIISPLHRLLEIFYTVFKDITDSVGLSVVGLSFIVTLCCLPLYVVSERWQETERQLQKKMNPMIRHIKATFSGDERYMILSAFYRENHYHPIMALRSSFGLLVQIPFFIAAYTFLSNMNALNGANFLFIKNMGLPDASFKIGTFAINILPIAMTIFNCVSGAIYSRGHSAKEKAQIYISAAVFLVLLYNSPSGLVLYWTMNNVLSLVKNIFYKFKNPLKVLYRFVCIFAVIAIFAISFSGLNFIIKILIIFFLLVTILSPLIIRFVCYLTDIFFSRTTSLEITATFLCSALAIALLTGLFVPSMLMESEPNNFCYVGTRTSPFPFLWTSFLQASGIFIFWPVCFYFLFNSTIKRILTFSFLFSAMFCTVNAILFSLSYSPLEPTLEFMENAGMLMLPSLKVALLNALCAFALLAMTIFLCKKKLKTAIFISGLIAFSLLSVSIKNNAGIAKEYARLENPANATKIDPIIHLSKTEKNIIFIMLDRAMMPFVQDIFNEKPSLAKSFDGFVLYPNTLSFAQYTIFGVPGLYGGYSYTPHEMNKRKDQTLQQKHNEALLSLPLLFSQNGFTSTVIDLPYENFLKHPTSAMYEPYPQINHYNAKGRFSALWYEQNNIKPSDYTAQAIEHNLVMLGLFKACPPIFRWLVYGHNNWWYASEDRSSYHKSAFINSYSVLDFLQELTDFNASKPSYIALNNESTHEPTYLQAPDYVPAEEITDRGNTKWKNDQQYHVQAAAFRKLADFFDYLKTEDVYDNTRIIIVSDHGSGLNSGLFDNSDPNLPQKEKIISCLMFKDFGSHTPSEIKEGSISEDMTFMTNADAPGLATQGLIDDAKNPFTNVPLSVKDKSPYLYFCLPKSISTRYAYETYFDAGDYYEVKDNIFDSKNWRKRNKSEE